MVPAAEKAGILVPPAGVLDLEDLEDLGDLQDL